MRDADFGPIRLRAFGTYTLKAIDPKILLKELVGTDSEFDAGEVTELLRGIINSSFADMLGEQKVAALDLAARYTEMGDSLKAVVNERIDDEYGLEVTNMMIVNVSLPEAVEKALDTRTSMGVIGDMNKFQAYQMGNAMQAAAENPGGGGASDGMGLGMGFAMANRFMGGAGNPMAGGAAPAPGHAAPPPPPPQQTSTSRSMVRLRARSLRSRSLRESAPARSARRRSSGQPAWMAGKPPAKSRNSPPPSPRHLPHHHRRSGKASQRRIQRRCDLAGSTALSRRYFTLIREVAVFCIQVRLLQSGKLNDRRETR